MKDINEFIETLVKVEFVEQSNCFGHYPFQLFVENKDSTFQLGALALGGDVAECYNRFNAAIANGARRIYMSLDFPALLDMENDFIGIFKYEGADVKLFLKSYNEKTGKVFGDTTECEAIDKILNDYNMIPK